MMALSEIMHDQLILVTLNHQNDYNYQVLLFTLGATPSSHAFLVAIILFHHKVSPVNLINFVL